MRPFEPGKAGEAAVAESEKSGNGVADSPFGRAVRRMLADNAFALAKAPRIGGGYSGQGLEPAEYGHRARIGLAGYAAGQVNRLRPGDQSDPRIQLRNNAVEFVNNPAGGVGAITLGNTIIYSGDPYDPSDKGWADYEKAAGHPIQEHEKQHTYQGQRLGPFYLPSNVAGLLLSRLRGEEDDLGNINGHGQSNWNERGPPMNPPRPWAARVRP